MMWMLVDAGQNIVQVALYAFFFSRCMDLKNNMAIRKFTFITGIFLIATTILFSFFDDTRYIAIAMLLIYCFFVFDGSIYGMMVWVINALVITGIADFLIMNLSVLFPGVTFTSTDVPGLQRMVCMASSKVLQFVCFYVATIRIQKNPDIKLPVSFILMVVPVGAWVVLEVLFSYSNEMVNPTQYQSLPIAGGIAMLFSVVATIALYNILSRQEKEYARVEMQLHTAQLTDAHIAQIKKIYGLLSAVQHDLKNHFTAINGYYSIGDYKSIGEYVHALGPIDYEYLVYVNHPVLDSLLSEKFSHISKGAVDFTVNIVLPVKIPINDADLCILFGSMLDNAVDATRYNTEENKGMIQLVAKSAEGYWVVVCKNSAASGSSRWLTNIPSSKKDGLHGIGTKQIIDIAKTTGGYAYFEKDAGYFTAVAMLKLPDASLEVVSE